jgi:rhomboid family GlyGly-CTERM serine protease
MLSELQIGRTRIASDWNLAEVLHATWLTGTLALAAIVASLIPGIAELLQFDRGAIAQGEFWRAITGNFVHWSVDHLLWDVLMFVILGAMIEFRSRRVFAAITALSAAAVSATVWMATPLATYRGLSGIDSALFVLLAAWFWLEARQGRGTLPEIIPVVLLLGFLGKIGYEIVTGQTYFVDSTAGGFIPLPQVHLAGAAAGLAVLGFAHGVRDQIVSIASRRESKSATDPAF